MEDGGWRLSKINLKAAYDVIKAAERRPNVFGNVRTCRLSDLAR